MVLINHSIRIRQAITAADNKCEYNMIPNSSDNFIINFFSILFAYKTSSIEKIRGKVKIYIIIAPGCNSYKNW